MRHLWTVLLVLFFSGCIPYSDHPLTESRTECLDPEVLGTWFVQDDGEIIFIHIGTDGQSKGLRLTLAEFDSNGELKTSELTGHTSLLSDKTYMNLRWAQPEEHTKGYLFVKYRVKENQLGIALMKAKPVESAIQQGRLKGEITKAQWTSSIRMMETPERLRDFFRKNDKDLFEELKYLKRLELTEGSGGPRLKTGSSEVSVSQKPGYAETVYSLGEEACQVSLTVYLSDVNRGIIQARSKCYGSFQRQIALFQKVIGKVLKDHELAGSFHTLFWGRLAPDLPQGTSEMSFRLALAAYQSPLWDKKRGRSKKEHENDVVVALANRGDIYRELKKVFANFHRSVRFARAEKVLITEAEKLPFFEPLKKHGVQPKDRLPFDCLTWFSVSRK